MQMARPFELKFKYGSRIPWLISQPFIRLALSLLLGMARTRLAFGALAIGLLSFFLLFNAAAGVWAKEAMQVAFDDQAMAASPPLTPEQAQLLVLTQTAETPGRRTRADQARLINASSPFSAEPVLAARPFSLPISVDRARALECLSQAIYYEAAFEPLEGRRAVAQVVLNRLRHPAFPKTVCWGRLRGRALVGLPVQLCLRRLPAPPAGLAGLVGSAPDRRRGPGTATSRSPSARPPTITPTMWRRTGPPSWPRSNASGRTSSTAGRVDGESRAPSPAAMRGSERLYGPAPSDASVLTIADAAPRTAPQASDSTDRRADNDLGGRLDADKGWQLTLPAETRSSLSTISASQGEAIGG